MMQKNKRFAFQQKLLLSYTIIILTFAVFSMVYWLVRIRSERLNSVRTNITMVTSQSNEVLNEVMADIDNIFYIHNTSTVFRNGLLSGSERFREISASITESLLLAYGKKLLGIVYYDALGNRYTNGDASSFWGEEHIYLENASRKHGIVSINDIFHGEVNNIITLVLPLSKEMYDIQTGRPMGEIIVYVNLWELCESISARLDSCYGTAIENDNAIFYVSKDQYRFLNNSEQTQILTDFMDELSRSKTAYGEILHDGQRYIIYGMQNQRLRWNIIKIQPANDLFNVLPSLTPFLAFTILMLAVLFLMSYLLSRNFSRNISNLHNALANTTNHHLEPLSEETLPNDEIGDLVRVFNSMICRLNKSIRREYIAKINARDMQISMLSYQINPHFLNNCLNTINSMAMLHDVPEISQIVLNLSKVFQYNLQGGNFVTLREEIENTKNYCALQHARFGARFEIAFHIAPGLEDALCIKFVLQPIVENCFSHGFQAANTSEQKQMISISITSREEVITITVTDNGQGISPDKLEEVRRKLCLEADSTALPTASIGMWNVNQRLKAHFGTEYGVSIDSVQGLYTNVRIRLPLLTMQQPVSPEFQEDAP